MGPSSRASNFGPPLGPARLTLRVLHRPYSGDHKERCLTFALGCRRPWALLLPAYVVEKRWFLDALETSGAKPFFLAPTGPKYEYTHPHGTGKVESPFHSLWIVDSGAGWDATDALFASCAALPCYTRGRARLHRDVASLAATKHVRAKKRPNPKARAKLRALSGKAAA